MIAGYKSRASQRARYGAGTGSNQYRPQRETADLVPGACPIRVRQDRSEGAPLMTTVQTHPSLLADMPAPCPIWCRVDHAAELQLDRPWRSDLVAPEGVRVELSQIAGEQPTLAIDFDEGGGADISQHQAQSLAAALGRATTMIGWDTPSGHAAQLEEAGLR